MTASLWVNLPPCSGFPAQPRGSVPLNGASQEASPPIPGSLSRWSRAHSRWTCSRVSTKAQVPTWRTRIQCRYMVHTWLTRLSPSPCPPFPAHRAASFLPQGCDAAGALSQACGLIQQLHRAYSGLASGLQGLSPELQQQLGQARHGLCQLYSLMSGARDVRELPAGQLAQSCEAVSQAWQGLERQLEGLQHGPPLGWLVGPFALLGSGQQL